MDSKTSDEPGHSEAATDAGSTSGYELRRATGDDAPALAACMETAYARYETRITDLPKVSAGNAEIIAEQAVWVAEQQGVVAGGVVIDLHGDVARLENIAVHPERSGAGIGKALIQLVEKEATDHGKSELRLSTHMDLPENVRYYERLGWKVCEASGNKIHMSKVISSRS